MPRPKIKTDSDVLETALGLMQKNGPDALTFAALAKASGLSGATLVQRFSSKAELVKAALLRAWDQLDARTADALGTTPKSPDGVVAMLVSLSGYGDIDNYADGLLILREDLRDPDLRLRGETWGAVLSRGIEDCLADISGLPSGFGRMVLCQWQGALLWWSFDPSEKVEDYVEKRMRDFLRATTGGAMT